eukprot:3182982-Pyramimonas_sp.AAC.1
MGTLARSAHTRRRKQHRSRIGTGCSCRTYHHSKIPKPGNQNDLGNAPRPALVWAPRCKWRSTLPKLVSTSSRLHSTDRHPNNH